MLPPWRADDVDVNFEFGSWKAGITVGLGHIELVVAVFGVDRAQAAAMISDAEKRIKLSHV